MAKEYLQGVYRKIFVRKCALPGCNKDCYVEDEWQHDYCGRSHAKQHAEIRRQEYYRTHQYQSYQYTSSPPTTGPIRFYNRDEPYYEFTNFYSASILIDTMWWPTTGHYFQAQKFIGTPYVEYIRRLSRPREAFDFVRMPSVSRWRRTDWEEVKIRVMKKALLAKFSQHPGLSLMLLRTRKRTLIEHSPHDSFWGDGGDGRGRNELGKLLMEIRTELQNRNQNSMKKGQPSPKNESNKGSPVDVDDCDRHKEISDSNKCPANEQSSSSPSSSEFSTPPEHMPSTGELRTERQGNNQTDQKSQEQDMMDTDNSTSDKSQTTEGNNHMEQKSPEQDSPMDTGIAAGTQTTEVPVADLIGFDNVPPMPQTRPQCVQPSESLLLSQLAQTPNADNCQFSPLALQSNSPQQTKGFESQQHECLHRENRTSELGRPFQAGEAMMQTENGDPTNELFPL